MSKKTLTKKPVAKKSTVKKEPTKPIAKKVVEEKSTPKVDEIKQKVVSKEKTIEIKVDAKKEIKNTDSKKIEAKKAPVKKEKTPIIDSKPTPEIIFKEFANVLEMKSHCVLIGLNRVDGYILASKTKKTDFINWMKDNVKNIKPQENPFSPSEGIGEVVVNNSIPSSNVIELEKNGIDPKQIGATQITKAEDVNIFIPPIKTSDNTNEAPTALTQNVEAMNYSKNNTVVETLKFGEGNEGLESYGKSMLHYIEESFSTRFHGAFTMAELQDMINKALKIYKYEICTKGGKYVTIDDNNGNIVRVPSNGYLPMD